MSAGGSGQGDWKIDLLGANISVVNAYFFPNAWMSSSSDSDAHETVTVDDGRDSDCEDIEDDGT